MGKSLQPLQEVDKIAYRTFENGIIVLNDGTKIGQLQSACLPDFITNSF